jgi:hypothetical protein
MDDPRGQYLVLVNPYAVKISARPDAGVNILVEDESGKIVMQARYISGWNHLQIILTEGIDA